VIDYILLMIISDRLRAYMSIREHCAKRKGSTQFKAPMQKETSHMWLIEVLSMKQQHRRLLPHDLRKFKKKKIKIIFPIPPFFSTPGNFIFVPE
jgi:hypothetical protein